jgi:magnesium chelatase family protein
MARRGRETGADATVAARVQAARVIAADRLADTGLVVNSQIPGRLSADRWAVPRGSLVLAERALEGGACRCAASTGCCG